MSVVNAWVSGPRLAAQPFSLFVDPLRVSFVINIEMKQMINEQNSNEEKWNELQNNEWNGQVKWMRLPGAKWKHEMKLLFCPGAEVLSGFEHNEQTNGVEAKDFIK